MELDELKKSWNALNEQLQKEPIADEQQITELIAGYKANTRKSLGRLVVIQRFSIGMGAVGLAALLLIWLLLPTFGFNEQLQGKIVALLGFIAISILIGMWWDWKTYRWNKDTRIGDTKITKFGISFNSDGTTTFFAQLEKSSASQKEYLEKLQEKKAAEKKEAKKKEQSKQTEVRKTTVQANSKEELLDKIKNIDWDSIKPEENKIGGRFGFAI